MTLIKGKLISEEDYEKYLELICYDNVKECGLVDGVAKILVFGAKKYAPNSWKTHQKDFLAACYRHLDIVSLHEPKKDSEKFPKYNLDALDKESGLLHLDHAICNLMFLRYNVIQQLQNDFKELK